MRGCPDSGGSGNRISGGQEAPLEGIAEALGGQMQYFALPRREHLVDVRSRSALIPSRTT